MLKEIAISVKKNGHRRKAPPRRNGSAAEENDRYVCAVRQREKTFRAADSLAEGSTLTHQSRLSNRAYFSMFLCGHRAKPRRNQHRPKMETENEDEELPIPPPRLKSGASPRRSAVPRDVRRACEQIRVFNKEISNKLAGWDSALFNWVAQAGPDKLPFGLLEQLGVKATLLSYARQSGNPRQVGAGHRSRQASLDAAEAKARQAKSGHL